MYRVMFLGVVLIAVPFTTACVDTRSGQSKMVYEKKGVSQEQHQADFADCEFKIKTNAGMLTHGEYTDRLALCLRGKGYKVSTQPI